MNFSLYTDFALNLKESQLQEVDVEKKRWCGKKAYLNSTGRRNLMAQKVASDPVLGQMF